MGMFDNIKSHYPLPVAGFQDRVFQTKDTPNQRLDNYKIHEDGTLWVEEYDIEDQSDCGIWERENPGLEIPEYLTGWESICGCMARINKRWVASDFSGEINFYNFLKDEKGWIEFQGIFEKGKLVGEIKLISYE